MRKLIVFDLDGTLAESKSAIDPETAGLLRGLLSVVQVAVVSGGAWPQFERQLVAPLAGGDYMNSAGLERGTVWGEVIEDRGSQVTFSALGQQAPLAQKLAWDPQFARRKKLQALLNTLIPEFSVRLGGATSIDVTRPGIDKAYGIRKLRDTLHIAIDEMIFIGDALFPGGNDFPAKEAGVLSIEVRDPHETKRVIETLVACLGASR